MVQYKKKPNLKYLPKVSIITPSFNQVNFIENTIKSVLKQDYQNIEYIIIDGGSNDGTIDIIKKYEKDVAYWISESDNGQSAAINKGLKVATGDIIGWINSDDVYYENAISSAIQILNEHPEIDIVFGNFDYIDVKGKIIHQSKEIKLNLLVYLFTQQCYHCNVAGLFRKKCFDAYGFIREDLTYSMDYELYIRFASNKCKFYQSNKILGAYRLHSQSKTSTAVNRFVAEAKMVSQSYKEKFEFNPIYDKSLKYLFTVYRLILKVFRGAYTPNHVMKGIRHRKQYGV